MSWTTRAAYVKIPGVSFRWPFQITAPTTNHMATCAAVHAKLIIIELKRQGKLQ